MYKNDLQSIITFIEALAHVHTRQSSQFVEEPKCVPFPIIGDWRFGGQNVSNAIEMAPINQPLEVVETAQMENNLAL